MGCKSQRFVKGESHAVGVHYKDGSGAEKYEEFDTVLLAIGRTGEATKLGLESAGVWFNPRNGKVDAPCERTNVPHIFCIGDLVDNRPELTPVAKATDHPGSSSFQPPERGRCSGCWQKADQASIQ